MNAKTEMLEHINNREVLFVHVKIVHYSLHYDEENKTIKGKLNEVLPLLDFEYDNGYGSQYFEGTIWYSDGSWSDRREYDGSEWWQSNICPPMP